LRNASNSCRFFFIAKRKPGKELGDDRYVHPDQVAVPERLNNTLVMDLEIGG